MAVANGRPACGSQAVGACDRRKERENGWRCERLQKPHFRSSVGARGDVKQTIWNKEREVDCRRREERTREQRCKQRKATALAMGGVGEGMELDCAVPLLACRCQRRFPHPRATPTRLHRRSRSLELAIPVVPKLRTTHLVHPQPLTILCLSHRPSVEGSRTFYRRIQSYVL